MRKLTFNLISSPTPFTKVATKGTSQAMLKIDGAHGEGGGQILRSSLGLSLVTGRPFTIHNIRGNRRKPGLLRQHLTAVQAATEVGRAETVGAEMRSSELSFRPRGIRSGDYTFAIGSAGSTSLVLQTILPALAKADAPSTVNISGGTHNPAAPPFSFLTQTLFPLLSRMGRSVQGELLRTGFYPAGGGKVSYRITPGPLKPLDLRARGELLRRSVDAAVSQLGGSIARRELFSLALKREIAFREVSFWAGIHCALQGQKNTCSVGGNDRACFSHSSLNSIGPSRINTPPFEQSVTLPHGFLITRRHRTMARNMRHDLAVKEAAAVGGAAAKAAVHIGGEPDDADEVGEVCDCGGCAVEADGALVACLGWFQPDAEFLLVIECGRDSPALRRVVAGHIRQGGGAQAATGADLGDGFENVGLARAIRAVQADRAHIEGQVEARMAAEVGQAETGEGCHATPAEILPRSRGRCPKGGGGKPPQL